MKLVDVTSGLVVWSINRSVASYASNNISGTIGGITLVGRRGSVYRIDVLITIANDEDCSASATASIAAGQILSGAVVNTISEIGFDGFNFINSATDFLHYGLDGFFRRGATDIPAGLGGGTVGSSGLYSQGWGLAYGSTRSTGTTTIKHNVIDTKFTVNVIPKNSFTWYLSSISAASSPTANNGDIIIVCSSNTAIFDFVILRTPY